MCTSLGRDDLSGTRPVKGRTCIIIAAFDGRPLTVLGDDDLFRDTHHGLEQVEIEPQLVVELVDGKRVGDRIQAVIAQIDTYWVAVALFDKGVVIAVIRSAAREMYPFHDLFPEVDQVMVKELAAIVGVDLEHGKRYPVEDEAKRIFHYHIAPS